MKWLIIVAFVAILASLGAALLFMTRSREDEDAQNQRKRMAKALAIRVIVSILLFSALLLAYQLGYIQPTGFVAAR